MRKLLILSLAAPATSHAQGLPFESAAGMMTGALSGMLSFLLPIAAVLAVIGAGVAFVMGKENIAGMIGKMMAPLVMMFVMIKMLGIFGGGSEFGSEDATPAPAPAVPEKPGMLSLAFDWIGAHLLPLGVGAGVVGVTAVVVTRTLSRRAARRLVKQNVRDLVEALDQVEALLQQWRTTVLGDDKLKRLAADSIATLTRIRADLIVMLEQAHGGVPLSESQRTAFAKAMKDSEKVARDAAAQAEVEPDARPGNAGAPRRVNPRPAAPPAALAGAAAVGSSNSLASDMLNPLNPLSPISPISVWSDNRHEATSSQSNDDQRRSFDAPSSRDECRYEPSSERDSGGSDSCSGSDSGSSDGGSFD